MIVSALSVTCLIVVVHLRLSHEERATFKLKLFNYCNKVVYFINDRKELFDNLISVLVLTVHQTLEMDIFTGPEIYGLQKETTQSVKFLPL